MIRHFRLLKLIFYKGRKDHYILATCNDNCKYKQVQKPHTEQHNNHIHNNTYKHVRGRQRIFNLTPWEPVPFSRFIFNRILYI